jgi:DNA primase
VDRAIDRLLPRLDGVRQTSPDTFAAKCPAHEDRSPSVSIRDAGDRVLIHCHAGCSAADIVAAVGLTLRDLYDSRLPAATRQAQARQRSRAELEDALSLELAVLALVLTPRIASRKNQGNKAMQIFRPEVRPYPAEHWDREILAARRIIKLLGRLYAPS